MGGEASAAAQTTPGSDVLAAAFARETRRGVALALFARLCLFGLLWASFYADAKGNLSNPYFLYRSGLMGLALAGGAANHLLTRRSADPVRWATAFFLVDAAILAALTFGWLPEAISDYPQFLAVRLQDAMIFAAVLATAVFPLAPRLMALAGGGVIAAWLAGLAVSFARTPGAITDLQARHGAQGWADVLARVSKPQVLSIAYVALQVVLLAGLAALLWLGVRRGRELVARAVEDEGRAAFLKRFFPPALAQQIAARGARGLPSGRGEVAVLFADIDGGADLERLKRWYALAERRVFEHQGLIDRFAGDPVMAVFGADTGDGAAPDAAGSALACADALQADLDREGLSGVVGLHFGEAVSGEVGSARHKAFGVVGDTVNLARRLMDAARADGRRLIASRAFADAAGGSLKPLGETPIRGQAQPVELWSR